MTWLLRTALAALSLGFAGDGVPVPPPGDGTASPTALEAAPVDILRARAEAFSRFRKPSPGKPSAVGSTSNGCLEGGMRLPTSGPGYEVLHLGRRRDHGHPLLVEYVQRLGAAAKKKRLGTLLVGDLAQARGGPTPTGHRSHQSGLDADIGFARPAWLAQRRMKPSEREQLFPPPVVDLTTRTLTAEWSPKVERADRAGRLGPRGGPPVRPPAHQARAV